MRLNEVLSVYMACTCICINSIRLRYKHVHCIVLEINLINKITLYSNLYWFYIFFRFFVFVTVTVLTVYV